MEERPTILIVDDTLANIKTLAGMLKEKYKITISKSGVEALELIQNGPLPDLVLLKQKQPPLVVVTVRLCLKGFLPVVAFAAP